MVSESENESSSKRATLCGRDRNCAEARFAIHKRARIAVFATPEACPASAAPELRA